MKNDKKELDKLRKIGESMNVSNKTINIWRKNRKQGYRFFEPHNANKLTPRTLREALGYKKYNELDMEQFYLQETGKAYIVGAIVLLVCIATWLF
jgi:Mn-dependent DtxR family transcriptional regulator